MNIYDKPYDYTHCVQAKDEEDNEEEKYFTKKGDDGESVLNV